MDELRFRENKLGQLLLDLLTLLAGKLEPEVSTVLRNAFPELDGRKLTDLHSSQLDLPGASRGGPGYARIQGA